MYKSKQIVIYVLSSECFRTGKSICSITVAKIHSRENIKFTLCVSVLSESFPLKSSTNALKALSRTNPKPFSCNQKPEHWRGRMAARGRKDDVMLVEAPRNLIYIFN